MFVLLFFIILLVFCCKKNNLSRKELENLNNLLLEATDKEDFESVKLLISKGANINVSTPDGYKPLIYKTHFFIVKMHFSIYKRLLMSYKTNFLIAKRLTVIIKPLRI